MALVLMRSAYSPVVRDTMDYSTALCDRHGRIVAQGLTLAVQLGSFPTMMRHLCAEHAGTSRPGDVFIANDPYGSGGQHLPDIYVIQPIFVDGELEGYAATMAHHADVGGIAPGSIAVHATEIFQEGLRLPLLKLHDQGVENEGLLRIIEKNTRQPTQVLGDLKAQVAACRAGAQGLARLVERYGEDVRRYLERLQETAEAAMRREIAGLADGTYEAVDVVDGFGDEPEPIEIRVTLTIRGGELEIDFTGYERSGRRQPQLPDRPDPRGVLLRDPRDRARRHPQLRGLHGPDPRRRAGGNRRESRSPCRLRRPRRDRLPRLRRDHARARAGRAGPRRGGG